MGLEPGICRRCRLRLARFQILNTTQNISLPSKIAGPLHYPKHILRRKSAPLCRTRRGSPNIKRTTPLTLARCAGRRATKRAGVDEADLGQLFFPSGQLAPKILQKYCKVPKSTAFFPRKKSSQKYYIFSAQEKIPKVLHFFPAQEKVPKSTTFFP